MKITFTTKTSFSPNANTGNRYLQLTKSTFRVPIQLAKKLLENPLEKPLEKPL